MGTFTAKPHEVERIWFVVDATDKPLGVCAVENIAAAQHAHTLPETTFTA